MFQFGTCPRCQLQIPQERLGSSPVICSECGFTDDLIEQRAEAQFERRFIQVAVLIAFIITVGFLQAASWDQYALSILPLKLKQWTGTASLQDLEQIAQICKERLKHDCVEQAYASQVEMGNNGARAELGKYQTRRGKIQVAAQTFHQYFQHGGLDLEASYQFAKVLGQIGQIDLAVNYYDQVLKARPDSLQITVTQNYVKMLMDHQRLEQALALIKNIRSSSPSAALFMDTEFKILSPVPKPQAQAQR